jgi:uncharacterized membrane protein
MLQFIHTALLWFCAIGCVLIGGVYFAFSTFVMRALGGLDQAAGASAMRAINETILHSLFMPLFFGTTAACVILPVLALVAGTLPGTGLTLLAAGLYLVGMFGVTVAFNVPMNNALASAPEGGDQALPVWRRYLRGWTLWNHVRTVASIIAGLLYMVVLVEA